MLLLLEMLQEMNCYPWLLPVKNLQLIQSQRVLWKLQKEENISYKTAESAKEIAGHGSVIKLDGSEVLAGNKN